MATGSVFENNRTQAVRIPAEMRFDAGVRKVNVRVVGPDRVLSPVDRVWDSFFLDSARSLRAMEDDENRCPGIALRPAFSDQEAEATDDVRIERGEQRPPEVRERLE